MCRGLRWRPLHHRRGQETLRFGPPRRNKRLSDAIDHGALCALTNSLGARAFYGQHRAAGDLHHQALRILGNRLVGILRDCLRHHTADSKATACAHRQIADAAC